MSTTHLKVLAIDPGERVGWATGVIRPVTYLDEADIKIDDPLKQVKTRDGYELRVEQHGISHLREFAVKLAEVINNYDIVIYETWRLRPDMAKKLVGNDMQTSQLIGMIRLSVWLSESTTLVSQGPSIKKTAERTTPPWLQAKLDKLPKAHDDAHDGDALLHLWHYYWERYK